MPPPRDRAKASKAGVPKAVKTKRSRGYVAFYSPLDGDWITVVRPNGRKFEVYRSPSPALLAQMLNAARGRLALPRGRKGGSGR